MARTLFVSDMDGTLLGGDARLSAETVSLLNRLAEKGGMFTVATARTAATVEPLLAGVRTSLPAIVMTGAGLWHRDTRTYSDLHYIPRDIVLHFQRHFGEVGLHPFDYVLRPDGMMTVYHGGAALSRPEAEFVAQRDRLPLKHFELGGFAPPEALDNHILVFGMGDAGQVHSVARRLEPLGCAMSVYSDTYTPGLALIELFAPGVSKAAAVSRLKADTGADRLVVYGDNLNDLPMLAVADVAVAVENACPEVRAAADIVIGANTASSVARHALMMHAESLKNC